MAQTQVGIKLTLDGAQQVEQGVRRVISSVDGLGTQFTRLGQLAAGAFSVRELVTAADAYATLTGRIKLASEGLGNAAQAQKQLFDIANTARTSVEGLSNTYASLARAAGESGRSQAELLRTTDTLAKAMTIGGGAAESQKAALMQFAQGLSVGTLRGEELNSVMEQAPRLAKALADGLGVPTGALKTLAEEGRITADAIFEALERSRAKIEQEFTQLPTTIGQALTVLNNSFMQTIGVFDETNKISSEFADAILGIGKNMDVVVPTVGAMAAGLVVLRTSATAAAVATGALGTAVGALGGPIGLIATALGIGATAWAAWKGAATESEKAVETQVINSDAEIQSRIDAQIGKLRERNRLATEGMPEAKTGVERAAADAGGLYAKQLSRYQQIQSGAGEFANLTEATRAALLQASAKSMAKAYGQYTELTAETAKQAEAKNKETFEKFTKGYKSAQDKAKEELAKYEKEFKPKIGIGISQAEYDAGFKAIEERTKKTASAAKATKELSDAEKEALAGLELYSNLIAETAGFQGDYAEKVSQLAEAYAKNKITLEGFTFAHEKLLAKQPAAVEATKMEAEARKVLTDAVMASARAYEEAQQAMDAQVQSLWQSMNAATQAGKDEAEALQFQLGLMGKSAEARALEIEQNKIRNRLKRELAAIETTPFENEGQRLAARVQAEENAARDMANAGLKVQIEAQKTVESEWRKTSDQIQQSLTDALMRGFESGKGFLQNLRDTAVNLFKTLVLRPVISAVMSPITAGLSGALGLAGAAQAGQAAAGGGAASTALSGLGLATSAFGSSLWAGMSTTFASGFSTLGLAIEGGLASIATGTASGIAAGLGQALGAVSAVALPAAVVANALGLFRKTTQVDNGIKGTIGYDSDLTLFDRMRKSGTLFSGPDYWDRDKAMDPKLAQALDTQVRAIYTAGEQYAAALGLTATGVRDITREIRISTEGLTDAQVKERLDAEFAALGESIAQSLLGTTQTITETVKEMQLVPGGEDMGMVYQEVEKTITRVVAVQSEYARAGETSAQTLARLAGSLTVVNSAFDMLGLTMLQASLASGDYASQLVDAVGGGYAFAQAAGSYFDNFYKESERVAFQTRLVTDELAKVGLAMPATREGFRALVEEQQALGPAGKDALAALLRVNGAFAQITPAAEVAAERLKEAAERLHDAFASAFGRAATAGEMGYLTDQVASGAVSMSAALKSITEGGTIEKLTLRLYELQGAEGYLAEIRGRELSLLSPASQELQKRIWALEDEAKASEAAGVIADQRIDLENQLLTLQGDTAELRRRELAALDPSNRALQETIWRLQDATAAQDAYAASLASAQAAYDRALSERNSAKSAVDQVLGEATGAYLSALQQQASAAQRVADLHREAAEKMLSVGKSLREFVSGEMVSGADQVTSQRLAQSDFSALLGRANAGDTEAYDQLSDAARTLLDKSREVMGQGEFDRVRASVLRSVQAAADAADAAAAASSAKAGAAQPDPMTEALSALQSADTALAEALRVATTIGAPLVETQRDLIAEYRKAKDTLAQAEDKLAKALDTLNDIKKNTGDTVKAIGELKIKLEAIDLGASATIDFILGSDLPADLKELALGGPRTVQATVDYLLGNLDSIPKPLMDVVLGTLTQFDVTTNFLVGSALPDDLKRLALTASDRVIKNTYDFLTGTTLTDDLKQLAVLSSGTISRTINFVAGSAELTDAQKKVAFNTLGDYTTTVKAVLDSTMSASIKKVVLDGVGVYEASVKAAAASNLPASLKKVLFDGAGDYLTTIKSTLDSSLTADQKELLLNATSSAQRVINMSVTGGSLNDEQKTFLNTAAGTISRALALTASGGSLTAEQSNFLGYAAATVSRVLSLSASGGSLTADQQAILNAVGGTTSSSVTATVAGTVTWNPSSGMETIFNAIKESTGWLDEIHGYIGVVASSVGSGGGWLKEIHGYLGLIYTRMGDGTQKVKSVSTTGTQTNFWSGGYTGPGGVYEPAGVVHKGEVVWSQGDIARAGGVAVVEAMRQGLRGYAAGGVVAAPSFTTLAYTPPAAVRQGASDTAALERRMDAVVQELREARRESARQIRILEQQLVEQSRMARDVRGISDNGLQVFTDPREPLDIKPTEAIPA